jgi:hypothetical protein
MLPGMAAITINTLENAIKALGAEGDYEVAVRACWAQGYRGKNLVSQAVRGRFMKIMIEGPPGSGKTRAVRELAAVLPGGLDVIDLDGDGSAAGSDRYRPAPLLLTPTRLDEGENKGRLEAAAQAAYNALWSQFLEQTTGASGEIRRGASSGVVMDSITSLVSFLMDNASAGQADLGADATDSEKQAAGRARAAMYSAAQIAARQIYGIAEEGIWLAPPGPVVGITIAHAKPETAPIAKGVANAGAFLGWKLAMGVQTATTLRSFPDFIVCCGMSAADTPGDKRIRYYAEVEEAKAGGAKARWSQAGGKDDPAERDPALAKIKALDLAGFVEHIHAHRSKINKRRICEFADSLK